MALSHVSDKSMDRDGEKAALLLSHLPTRPFKTGLSLRASAHRMYAAHPSSPCLSCNSDLRLLSSPSSALSFTLPYQWTLPLARRPILVLSPFLRHPQRSGLHRPIPNETLLTLVSSYPDSQQTPSLHPLS